MAAVVLESPYADFRHAAMTHMDRLGLPGRLFQRMALALAESLSRARYDEVSPVKLIPRLRCPVLVIESENDPFLTAGDRAALAAAVRESAAGDLWTVQGVQHLMAVSADTRRYRARIGAFLARAVTPPAPQSAARTRVS